MISVSLNSLGRVPHLALAAAALAPSLAAQPFPANKIEFSNWYLSGREERFPNFASGNLDGDGLFKILPRSILDRHDAHQFSGYVMGVSVDDAYTGRYPTVLFLPGLQLYRTVIARQSGTTYETVDLQSPVGLKLDPLPLFLNSDGSWIVEVGFDPGSVSPKLRQLLQIDGLVGGERAGLALMALGRAGERSSASLPGAVMLSSYQERHFAPGYPSYSGSHDAATGTVAHFGTTGQPSATGELVLSARFANPTLQLFSDSAGGVANDPAGFETHMGPGAYATDHATAVAPGWFGMFVQAEQYDPGTGSPRHLALPLIVATSAAGPTAAIDVGGGVHLRLAPAELALATLFLDAGLSGPLATYAAGGVAGFDTDQPGVYATPRIPLPANPTWKGTALWLQALVVDDNMLPVGSTNAVRLTFD